MQIRPSELLGLINLKTKFIKKRTVTGYGQLAFIPSLVSRVFTGRCRYAGVMITTCFLMVVNSLASSVFTEPVGYRVVESESGMSIVSVPFVSQSSVELTVESVSPGGILFFAERVTVPERSYIHVLSGHASGAVASIYSAIDYQVELEFNLGIAAGDRVAIRQHQTVDSILGEANFSGGDTLTFYNIDGTAEVLSYFEGFGWYDSSFEYAGDVSMFPGEAWVANTSSGFSFICYGAVLAHPINVYFGAQSVALIGSLNPVEELSIGEVFASSLRGGDTVTRYESVDGRLVPLGVYSYFDGFGFYDDSFQLSDHVTIGLAGGVVLVSGEAGFISLPPAFQPSED